MSDTIPTPEPVAQSTAPTAATPAAASTPPASPPKKGAVSLAALILGIIAIVCAFIPGLSFIAFLPALAALTLGIVGLLTKAPGRGKALTGVILGPVALVVAIIVSVSFIAGTVQQNVDVADPAPATGESAADEPADAEPEPVEETPDEGTRANPAPAGSIIEISDNSGPIWQVQIGAANLNAADIIAAENMFNDAADAGSQYILVPVTYTYVGTTSGTPWLDVDIEFVSAAGTTHTDEFVVVPNSYRDINEMYAGASATGNLVVMAPSADIELGTWAISTFMSAPYFVKVV